MNRIFNIAYITVLLSVLISALSSCQQDVLDDPANREELIRQGRYMRAVNWGSYAADINMEARLFEEGTPYRLIAFTTPYDASNPTPTTPTPLKDLNPRFNKVAWEGQEPNGLHFMNIDSDPSKWFGFKAIDKEMPGDDGLVSLSFYGFTYGVPDDNTENYIQIDGWQYEQTSLKDLSYTETVTDGKLNDLMRGVLLNQNISTAGVAGTDADGNQIPTFGTQSVMPFRHCFSKLHFQVSQQAKVDETDADGNPIPAFENLIVEKVEVTNTYGSGTVMLHDGKVQLNGKPIDRTLHLNERFDGTVTTNNTDLGEMIVFPSYGNDLNNSDLADGYKVGLKITVKSTVKADIENMLVNTGSPGSVTQETVDGVTWYKGTIVKTEIIDYYTSVTAANRSLYLKQNTSYMLIITFQKDAVRIITVIPMIEEWIPGEGTPGDPWQYQAVGRPQMFDNILWSDRNLGADHFDARGQNYEESVGYFYQAGRNIPYYPYKYRNYDIANGIMPDINNKLGQDLANGDSQYNTTEYRFFPIVDSRLLRMTGNREWAFRTNGSDAQMYIQESTPEGKYFDFARGTDKDNTLGLYDNQDIHWEDGQALQPVAGAWEIPTSQQFLSIFPSTPHAGNITFRTGGNNARPIGWGGDRGLSEDIKVLRVTVPHYWVGAEHPYKQNASQKYIDAWNTLYKNNDEGATDDRLYIGIDGTLGLGPGAVSNPNSEPDGDPEDGYASVYVISREEGSVEAPAILQTGNWAVRQWGTIYAIKRVYTSEAYRMRWRVFDANKDAKNPCLYIEICRYRCDANDHLTVTNYKTEYDWDHPVATIYMPIGGLGDYDGKYINFGTECQYATSDPIENGKTSAVQIKLTGHDTYNCYIAVVTGVIDRTFGKQIRPVRIGGGGKSQQIR